MDRFGEALRLLVVSHVAAVRELDQIGAWDVLSQMAATLRSIGWLLSPRMMRHGTRNVSRSCVLIV
jgi:hypothetical protein